MNEYLRLFITIIIIVGGNFRNDYWPTPAWEQKQKLYCEKMATCATMTTDLDNYYLLNYEDFHLLHKVTSGNGREKRTEGDFGMGTVKDGYSCCEKTIKMCVNRACATISIIFLGVFMISYGFSHGLSFAPRNRRSVCLFGVVFIGMVFKV